MPAKTAAQRAAALLGRKGGSAKSAAKAAASAANGAKGGRPRGYYCSECGDQAGDDGPYSTFRSCPQHPRAPLTLGRK